MLWIFIKYNLYDTLAFAVKKQITAQIGCFEMKKDVFNRKKNLFELLQKRIL